MKEKLKMIQVREEAHKELKLQALKANMSIKDYVEFLLSKGQECKK